MKWFWPWQTAKVTEVLVALELANEVIALKREKIQLTDRIAELKVDSIQQTREIEHKVGLHRIQVQAETDIALRKARLDVDQANLTADKTRFEENLKFTRDQMNGQLTDMKDILKSIIARLPEEKVSTTLTGKRR
jgi:hypothetical protein